MSEIVACAFFALLAGLAAGLGFWIVSGRELRPGTIIRTTVICGLVGFTVGSLLPVNEHRIMAIMGLSAIFSVDGGYIRWAIFEAPRA